MHVLATQFAVEKTIALSECAKRSHKHVVAAAVPAADPLTTALGTSTATIILVAHPQNHGQVFAPESRTRCHPPAQTRTRLRNRHRGSSRVRFSNHQRLVL